MIPQIFFTNQSKLFVQLNKQNNINLVHTLYSMNEQTKTNPAFKRIKRLTPNEFLNQCENDNKISKEQLDSMKQLKASNKKQSDPSYWGTYDRMVKFGYSDNEALAEAENYRTDSKWVKQIIIFMILLTRLYIFMRI